MIPAIKTLLENLRFADFIDIVVISVLLYYTLTWIRRRASRSVIIALAGVISIYMLARMLNMYLTSMFFQAGLTAALVALVIIFQEDIRMLLEQAAAWGTYKRRDLLASGRTIDCLTDSFRNLARDKIGALVVIKGRDSLDRHLSGGISINGRLSIPLLYSIFHPSTPSHDGAVIIEGDRIDRFAVRLPLSHNNSEVGEKGTRHTAALGLSERSDALVIVASEERGVISIAEQGHITQVSAEVLKNRLENFYRKMWPESSPDKRFRLLTMNAGAKIASVFVSILLWVLLAYKTETVNRVFTVPVEYTNIPSEWIMETPKPTEVLVSLSGKERAFNFDPSSLVLSLDMSNVNEGTRKIHIQKSDFNTPSGLKVNRITPEIVTITAQQFVTVNLPVHVKTTGYLSPSLKLVEIKTQPQLVKVLVPQRKKDRFDEITTEVFNLAKISGTATQKLQLRLPPNAHLVNESESTVRASVIIDKTANK